MLICRLSSFEDKVPLYFYNYQSSLKWECISVLMNPVLYNLMGYKLCNFHSVFRKNSKYNNRKDKADRSIRLCFHRNNEGKLHYTYYPLGSRMERKQSNLLKMSNTGILGDKEDKLG